VEATPSPRLAEVCATLSLATDLALGQPMESGLRACLVAVGLGEAIGLGSQDRGDVYYLTLLRMAGCTSTPELERLLGDPTRLAARVDAAGVDFADRRSAMPLVVRNVVEGQPPLRKVTGLARLAGLRPSLMREVQRGHCEVAERLAERLSVTDGVRRALGAVYERWDGGGNPSGASGEAIPLVARVMHIAHHVEPQHRRGGVEAAVDIARRRAGGALDPSLVASFAAHAEEILAVLEEPSPWTTVLDGEPAPHRPIDDDGLDAAAAVLGDFSESTAWSRGHARVVARLVDGALATDTIDPAEAVATRRAAFLLDLGRVTVGLPTLNKPGPLTDLEWDEVRLHAYHTERLLTRTSALRRAGELAGLHHERLDGSGYHRRAAAPAIPPSARILAAADAYAAMTGDRPYRPALPPDRAAGELETMATREWLDPVAVHAVLDAAGQRRGPRPVNRPAGLTDREVDVLRAVARGLSIKQAARALDLSPKTVDGHLQRIYPKLGVSTRAAATLLAVELGLLDDRRRL
jgi:HD-GYP domain-containing protein (c-di-GMP phosphodiesterase class II)